MYINELKVIEVLLTYLDNKKDLNRIIEENFHDNELFNFSRINLFNLVCIKSIISSNPNLSEKEIKKIVNEIEVISDNNLSDKEIYKEIIEALKNNKYYLDKDNNVVITASYFTCVVSSSWIYNLSTISRKNTFSRVLLFNKNEELDINDEKGLLNYLYHTKMFLVNMTNGKDLDKVYKHALINSKGYLIGKDSIKSNDIIEAFLRNISSDVDVRVAKYDFNNYRRIISILNKIPNFYNYELKKQKEIIEQVILEDESTNTIDYLNLNRLILLIDTNSDKNIIGEVEIEKCYIALFKMYMYILKNMDLDYSSLYLSKIRIKSFVDESMQEDYLTLKCIIRDINDPEYNKKLTDLKENIARSVQLANSLRKEDKEKETYESYKKIGKLVDKYVERENNLRILGERRNSIQNLIHYKKNNSVLDIAFDNDIIMELISEAIKDGRIYIEDKNIVIDINNREMGMNTFHALIPIDDFLYLVECTNEDISTLQRKKSA